MIQARSFTAEGAEFLAEVAEKNSLRVPSRKPLRTKDPTPFFEQDSKVKTSRRDETFIDKAAPEIRGAPEERNISKRATFRSCGAAASWLCHSYKHSDSCGASSGTFKDLFGGLLVLCVPLRKPLRPLRLRFHGATSYSGFGMPLSQ